jgi:transcriptional regulator with XRE-family HTH domain
MTFVELQPPIVLWEHRAVADHTPSVVISDLVKTERKRLGLTQEQLGTAVGVTQATISNWEGGQTSPNPAEAARLAAALGHDPIDLIGRLWPDVADLDRMARLRVILAGATASELAALEQVAAQMMRDRAAPRSKSRGRR